MSVHWAACPSGHRRTNRDILGPRPHWHSRPAPYDPGWATAVPMRNESSTPTCPRPTCSRGRAGTCSVTEAHFHRAAHYPGPVRRRIDITASSKGVIWRDRSKWPAARNPKRRCQNRDGEPQPHRRCSWRKHMNVRDMMMLARMPVKRRPCAHGNHNE